MVSSLPTLRKETQQDGFTFVEVLISIGVAVVILTVGGFYLSGIHSSSRIESQAQELITLLRAAQEKAASQENNARWGVYINNEAGPANPDGSATATGSYTLYQVNEALLAAGPPYTDVPGTILTRQQLPSGVVFSPPVPGALINVVFSKGTGLPNAGTAVTLRPSLSSSEMRTVIIDANGRIE